jgi:PadR family transcriptional regulator AphA
LSLRHALLALLEAEPMSGYSLAKFFDQSVAYVWHAPHSQIYPELRRMHEAGLISGRSEARGTFATKRIYSLTDAGLEELERWTEEIAALQPERDAAYLKATYFEYGSFASARRQFEAHKAHHEEQRRRWEAHVKLLENRDTDLMRIRLARTPDHLHRPVVAYKVHVYHGLIERAKQEVRWAVAGLRMVDELEAESVAAGRKTRARTAGKAAERTKSAEPPSSRVSRRHEPPRR